MYAVRPSMVLQALRRTFKMNKVAALTVSILLFSSPAVFGQDSMQYGVKHLTVLAEDQKSASVALRAAQRGQDSHPFPPIGGGVCAQRGKG